MPVTLTRKERILRQIRGQEIDRVPALGGWMLGIPNIASLAAISIAEYMADPLGGVVKANLALDVDGMIQPIIPESLDQIRTGLVQEETFAGVEPEALLGKAHAYPDTEKEVLASFDFAAEEARYRAYFTGAFRLWGGIEPIPNFWEIGGHFPLYTEFGYVAFLTACALYPEAVGKIYWAKSVHSRERAKILLKLYKEFDLVPLMFCGEDLANNKGPMVSPKFLRQHYLPTVKMIAEPLVNAGVRLIHHCDGDVRPLLQDYIAAGFSGFQGFQLELGLDPYQIKQMRGPFGEELIFFTGLSVSRTLPFGSLEDVREEVEYFLDFTAGGRNMFLFTTNVSGVECPPENMRAAYDHLKTWDPSLPRVPKRLKWPWLQTHPE